MALVVPTFKCLIVGYKPKLKRSGLHSRYFFNASQRSVAKTGSELISCPILRHMMSLPYQLCKISSLLWLINAISEPIFLCVKE